VDCILAKSAARMENRLLRVGSFSALFLMISLSFLAGGCSSTSSSTSGGTPSGGKFSNANLSGSYTYTMGGSFFGLGSGNGFYKRAGTFAADGNGHITSGSDDFVQGSAPVTNTISGSYSIAGDGTGLMTLVIGGVQLQWAISMVSDSRATLIEFDAFATGNGSAVLQTTSAFTSPPNGTFVFHVHSFQGTSASEDAVSNIGSMTISTTSGTTSVTGDEDVVRSGTFSSTTFTGSLTAPDATGKGTLSLTDAEGFSPTYFYYVIDANTLSLLETDVNQNGAEFGIGEADMQSGAPFGLGSLNNQFVFFSSGDTQTTLLGVVTVGVFSTDGNGNITGGSYDSVPDGNPVANATLGGTYDISPKGRATINLTTTAPGLSSLPYVAWMVSPSLAYYVVNIPGRAEDGSIEQQSGSPFSNSSVNGQYSFFMYGHDALSPPLVDRLGVSSFDGKSSLTLSDYFVNRGGSRNQTNAAAVTYSVAANGRVTAAIPGITSALVGYVDSSGSVAFILEDPQVEVAGGFTLQAP
jgi:hypothetical protein